MAKSLGAAKFRVKNEPQNSPAEFARRYGTPTPDIGKDIGNETRKVGLALAPSASDRAAAKRAAARRN